MRHALRISSSAGVVGLRFTQSDLQFAAADRIVIVLAGISRYVRNLMRYRRLRVGGGCYFFTAVTHRRKPLFDDAQTVDMLFQVIGRVEQRHSFSIDAYVILPDHIHMIWSLPHNDADFSTRWMLIKTAFTRAYRKTRFQGSRVDKQPIGRTASGNT
jgi:REP element-mobilizing transposase RayT